MLTHTLTSTSPGITVATLAGRLTAGDALREIETQLKALLLPAGGGPTQKLIVDLSQIDVTDSAGIGMLMQTHITAASANAVFSVAGANPRVLSVLRMTRIDKVLALYPTLAEAAAAD